MIKNWELVNRIDHQTKEICYTLLIDGNEQDSRLLARKLKGYVKEVHPAEAPYVYAFELPSDIDERTQDKIRTATEEGVALSNKIDQFVPGGVLGDPLFNTSISNGNKDYPTFLTIVPLNNASEKAPLNRPSLDLNTLAFIPKPDVIELAQKRVIMDESPQQTRVQKTSIDETQLSTVAREVFEPARTQDAEFADLTFQPVEEEQTSQPDPLPQAKAQEKNPAEDAAAPVASSGTVQPTGTISISDQDMLLKDMEGSVLDKLPLNEILSAQTKHDMFVDVNSVSTNGQNIQPAQGNKPKVTPDKDAFNVFEPGTTETDNLLDVAEVHAITENLTQKSTNFMNKPDIPKQNLHIPDAPQEQPAEVPFTLGSSQEPKLHPLADISGEGLPQEETLEATLPPAQSSEDNLPDITVRGVSHPKLEKTFNLETTFNTELIKRQHDKEVSLREGHPAPPPAQPAAPAPHPQKTVLHLRAPGLRPSNPPQDPGKTMLRLRRKETAPQAPDTPKAPQPLHSTMSPERAAENLRLAKAKNIDHSIEIPISELKKHNWPLEVPLVPTYTMNNMVMSVNRFAHATAISVIDNPGKLYNPLVLHGGTGTGKTHFLNALAYSFSQKFGQEHIFMTNGVRFSRGIQRYVMEGNIAKFEDFMDSVKALLIDDIHLLAINEQNRDFISKLLNSFLKNQKQIVITSKYPPESLEKLEELIKFRLDSGWISELKPATGATHFRIVKKMLIENGVDLNDKQIEEFFGRSHMTLGTVTRSIRRLKVLENLLFQNLVQENTSQASIFEKLLATKGEDTSSELINKDPAEITSISTTGNGEWGRIGFFYPQNCSDMMNWMVYALEQRAKELGIEGGFEIVVRSSYATENIISSAFKIANLCDNKKLKGAVILGPKPNTCDPSVRENFYDILTHMLEIMLIRCGIINYEDVRLPSTYVKVISELMR